MKKLLEFVEDRKGKLSSRKLAFLLWCLSILVAWIWLSYLKNEMQDLPPEIKWIIGALGGAYISGNYIENKRDNEEKSDQSH